MTTPNRTQNELVMENPNRVDYKFEFSLIREYQEPITDTEWEKLQELVGELISSGYNSNEELETFIWDWIYESESKWREEEEVQ